MMGLGGGKITSKVSEPGPADISDSARHSTALRGRVGDRENVALAEVAARVTKRMTGVARPRNNSHSLGMPMSSASRATVAHEGPLERPLRRGKRRVVLDEDGPLADAHQAGPLERPVQVPGPHDMLGVPLGTAPARRKKSVNMNGSPGRTVTSEASRSLTATTPPGPDHPADTHPTHDAARRHRSTARRSHTTRRRRRVRVRQPTEITLVLRSGQDGQLWPGRELRRSRRPGRSR